VKREVLNFEPLAFLIEDSIMFSEYLLSDGYAKGVDDGYIKS